MGIFEYWLCVGLALCVVAIVSKLLENLFFDWQDRQLNSNLKLRVQKGEPVDSNSKDGERNDS